MSDEFDRRMREAVEATFRMYHHALRVMDMPRKELEQRFYEELIQRNDRAREASRATNKETCESFGNPYGGDVWGRRCSPSRRVWLWDDAFFGWREVFGDEAQSYWDEHD